MALEALSPNEFLNFIIYDTISATPCNSSGHDSHNSLDTGFLSGNNNHALKPEIHQGNISVTAALDNQVIVVQKGQCLTGIPETTGRWKRQNFTSTTTIHQGRRKRRRKPRVCKNKEEAETQRMTHIAVERNRRRQMNEHLAVLRSLMPESHVQRGDQASIVGGAIEFVKELEHLLQSLEAQKLQILQAQRGSNNAESSSSNSKFQPPPFSQFFVYPQYIWSQMPHKYTSKTMAAIADIEVTLIETHANLRILSRRSPRQLSKLITTFQTLYLTILHVNVTTFDELVLYSISAKLEEGCQLTSVDDIAGAIHHMLPYADHMDSFAAPVALWFKGNITIKGCHHFFLSVCVAITFLIRIFPFM